MAAEILVETQIEDGRRLVEQLVRDDFDVAVAFWCKTSEESLWHLYIASPLVDPKRPGDAYRPVYASLNKLAGSCIQISDLKLANEANPIARAAIEVRDRYPAPLATRYEGKRLGNLSIEEAYIYPPFREDFAGFEQIKRQFPSAEIFTLTIPIRGQNLTGWLLPTTSPLMGKINDREFEGRDAGTLLFISPEASGDSPVGKLLFVHRPEGWNKMFDADTKTWEEVASVGTGKRLYESEDFSPLAGLKTSS